MTVAGSVGAASLGSTPKQRCSRRPSSSTPPERVSSPPFSSDETHVSQQSSTAACTVDDHVMFMVCVPLHKIDSKVEALTAETNKA